MDELAQRRIQVLRKAAAGQEPENALAALERRLRFLRGAAFGAPGDYDPEAFDDALLAHRAALARAGRAAAPGGLQPAALSRTGRAGRAGRAGRERGVTVSGGPRTLRCPRRR